MTRPARPTEEVHAIREAILDAAILVFARKGYQAATMAEIARQAGFAAASLYNYFPGKLEIFDAMVARLDEEYLAVFDEPPPADRDFAGRIEALVRRQLEVTRRRRGVFRIYLSLQGGAGTIPSERAARGHAANFRSYMARYADWMRAALAGTGVSGRSGEELAYSLWGLQVAVQTRALSAVAGLSPAERLASEEAEVKSLLDMFLNGASGGARR
jgi:AcrR family transcriptional regulator